MQENYTGRILIDPSIEGNYYADAADAAGSLESMIMDHPSDSTQALTAYAKVLENPAMTTAELAHPAGNSSEHQREIARMVARVLTTTDHGSFLDFDIHTYDVLDTDPDHQRLVREARNSDRRRGDPLLARRRVALNALRTFVQTWHASEQPDGDPDGNHRAA